MQTSLAATSNWFSARAERPDWEPTAGDRIHALKEKVADSSVGRLVGFLCKMNVASIPMSLERANAAYGLNQNELGRGDKLVINQMGGMFQGASGAVKQLFHSTKNPAQDSNMQAIQLAQSRELMAAIQGMTSGHAGGVGGH